MAVCCQNLTLGALGSRSALSMLVGALFKKVGLFLNTVVHSTPLMMSQYTEAVRDVPADPGHPRDEAAALGVTIKVRPVLKCIFLRDHWVL
jgi:ABC-type molybdate transport system permease subunit